MDFFCDEIVLSIRQFKSELKNKLYNFPKNTEDKWNLEEKLSYLEFLKKGYPDMGIIIDVKERDKRIILDGIERCKVFEEFDGEDFIDIENKRIRLFELRGTNKEKLEFLRYANCNGRSKSDSELRKLIYSEYAEYSQIESLSQIFKSFYNDISVDFLLKILSRVTIKELLEENEMIESYLYKYMKTEKIKNREINSKFFNFSHPDSLYLKKLFIEEENKTTKVSFDSPLNNNIENLFDFFLEKIIDYIEKEINYEKVIHTSLTNQVLANLELDLKTIRNNYNENFGSKILNLKNTFKQLNKKNIHVGLSVKSMEKDFYKYYKNRVVK